MMQKMKEQGITMEMPTTFDLSKLKSLPKRTDIQYHDNQGYNLTVTNLPWRDKPFTVKRFRLTLTDDFTLVEQKRSEGASISFSNPLPPPGLELIVFEVQ